MYFDFSMKYMYDDDTIITKKQQSETTETKEDVEFGIKIVKLGGHRDENEKQVKIKLPKKKSNAMIINHKIYF